MCVTFCKVVKPPILIKRSLPINTHLFVIDSQKTKIIEKNGCLIHEANCIITRLGLNGKDRLKGIQRLRILIKKKPLIKAPTSAVVLTQVTRQLTWHEKVAKILSNTLLTLNMQSYCEYNGLYGPDEAFTHGCYRFMLEIFGIDLARMPHNYFNVEMSEQFKKLVESVDIDDKLIKSTELTINYKTVIEDFVAKRLTC